MLHIFIGHTEIFVVLKILKSLKIELTVNLFIFWVQKAWHVINFPS